MDWQPLFLSIRVAVFATLLAGILGVGLGALLSRRRVPGRELIDAISTVPMVLPPTVLGYYLLVSIGRTSVLGRAWERATGSSIAFTVVGAIIAATVGSLPLVVKSARAGFEEVDPVLVDAARTLGAGPLRAFLTVELPLASRGILAGITLGFARALGDFGVTLMLAGDLPGETQTAALAIYDMIAAQRESEASMMALILAVSSVVALYAVNLLVRKRKRAV